MLEELEIKEDKILQIIGLELMFSTPQSREYSEGLTAIEISRKHNIKLADVKKKLKILQDKQLVRCIGVNPKFWQFDNYNFLRIDEDDPIYRLLVCFDDVDFDSFFDF